MPDKLGRAVSWLAERAIGAYFLHCAIMWGLGPEITIFGQTLSRTGAWWSMLVYTLIIYTLSLAVVSILSMIPVIRKLVT